MNLSGAISILGMAITLIGAVIGAKGFWKEKDNVYYGRAFIYFFNLEYYASMTIQKYKSTLAFIYISIGTGLQMSSYMIDSQTIYTSNFTTNMLVLISAVAIWLTSEKISDNMAWRVIQNRIVKPYFEELQNGNLNEVQTEEKWKNIYYVLKNGKDIDFEKIDQKKLKKEIDKFLT